MRKTFSDVIDCSEISIFFYHKCIYLLVKKHFHLLEGCFNYIYKSLSLSFEKSSDLMKDDMRFSLSYIILKIHNHF